MPDIKTEIEYVLSKRWALEGTQRAHNVLSMALYEIRRLEALNKIKEQKEQNK